MSIPVASHTIQTNLTQAANLLVEDTTGKPINWKLNVSQTEEFKDGKQVLPATLFIKMVIRHKSSKKNIRSHFL